MPDSLTEILVGKLKKDLDFFLLKEVIEILSIFSSTVLVTESFYVKY